MSGSKEVPSWFKLENYDAAKTFTAIRWVQEIDSRLAMRSALCSEIASSDPSSIDAGSRAFAVDTVDQIKTNGLISEDFLALDPVSLSSKRWAKMQRFAKAYGKFEHTTASVKSMSVFDAWHMLCESNRFEEIDRALKEFRKLRFPKDMKRSAQIDAKYSHPLSMIGTKFEIECDRFAVIDLEASDQQIMREFSTWLSEQRSRYYDLPVPKKLFTSTDFSDWHEAGILPYFDLTTIAKIDNKKLPLHAIGDALFPNEIDVDVAERVRKVTKRKASQIFRLGTLWALDQQVRLEQLKAE
jgi:hypothetical protein